MGDEISDEDKRRLAIFLLVFCLLTITITAFMDYFTIFQAI